MTMTLRVGRTSDRCTVLGPGLRAVIWVTGCRLRCRECIAPEFLDPRAGEDLAVSALAEWILCLEEIDGVTLSGGEPFEQAAALCAVLDAVRAVKPELSAMAFTGYTLARLRSHASADQLALLRRLDLVIDGPYVPARHSAKRWRGSSNQQLHRLSERWPLGLGDLDQSAGIEVAVAADGGFALAGVPASRGFRAAFEERLAAEGIFATTEEQP